MTESKSATRLLLLVIAGHFLVDTVASVINPLWPTLKAQTSSSEWTFFALYLSWNITTSASQIIFSLIGERFGGRWMIWGGPAIAILSLCLLGYVASPWTLGILTTSAAMGIAAFHPEAATTAGNCFPEQRSRAMSLFQLGGFLGQTVGPYFSGVLVARWGTTGLLPGLLWMLSAVVLLRWGMSHPDTANRMEKKSDAPWYTPFQGRIASLSILLATGVTRIVPAAGIPLALAFLETSRQSSTADIGLVQSAFTFGIGGGGLLCALIVRPRYESMLLWLLPLLSAPVMMALPYATSIWLLLCATTTGLLLGTTLPILIGRGQQLIPQSQRIGSTITMGLSWGIGGGIAAMILMACERSARIDQTFPLFAMSAVASCVLCFFLPHPAMIAEKLQNR